jgi:predicted transcriptional regulator
MNTIDGIESSVSITADSKEIILEQIGKTPEIRYKELLRLTGLTNGTLEYHLNRLEMSNKVQVDRHDGRRTR